MTPLRIAIAGCGISGLASALLLSRLGHSVCLFDQFDAPQAVGSGMMLQPTGMAVLEKLGLAQAAYERGAEIDGLWGLNENGRMALGARYADLKNTNCLGIGIHRSSLFGLLYDCVRDAGIPIQTGWRVAEAVRDGQLIRITDPDGKTSESYDLLVDALGLHSPLVGKAFKYLKFGALWANITWPEGSAFKPRLLEQRYRAANQMAGMLPIGRRSTEAPAEAAFFWSIIGSEYAAWRNTPLNQWKAQVTDLWPDCTAVLDQITSHDDLAFARYAHRTMANPIGDRIIHIGDAWHSASPQLGQGANMALLDAWALSQGLKEGHSLQEGLRMAAKWRSDHVQLYQWVTAFFTPLFQSDHAWPAIIRDRITAPLSRYWPAKQIQTMLLSGLFGAPLQQLGLEVPDYSVFSTAANIASRASALDQS